MGECGELKILQYRALMIQILLLSKIRSSGLGGDWVGRRVSSSKADATNLPFSTKKFRFRSFSRYGLIA
jgi:hypothetical protein